MRSTKVTAIRWALKYSSQILWELDYSVGGTSMYEDVS